MVIVVDSEWGLLYLLSMIRHYFFIVQPNFSPSNDFSNVDKDDRLLLAPATLVATARSLSASNSMYSSLPLTVAVQLSVDSPREPCITSLFEFASKVYVPL